VNNDRLGPDSVDIYPVCLDGSASSASSSLVPPVIHSLTGLVVVQLSFTTRNVPW